MASWIGGAATQPLARNPRGTVAWWRASRVARWLGATVAG